MGRIVSPAPARDLLGLAGRYYSWEVDATYDVVVKDTIVTVRRPRGEVESLSFRAPQPRTPADTLIGFRPRRTFVVGDLTYSFAPNEAGNAPSFVVDIGRARGIEFARVPASTAKE